MMEVDFLSGLEVNTFSFFCLHQLNVTFIQISHYFSFFISYCLIKIIKSIFIKFIFKDFIFIYEVVKFFARDTFSLLCLSWWICRKADIHGRRFLLIRSSFFLDSSISKLLFFFCFYSYPTIGNFHVFALHFSVITVNFNFLIFIKL